MDCSQVQSKLSCYLDGVLDEATLEAIEAHVEQCDDCRRELGALRAIVGIASEMREVEPPAYLKSAIRDAVSRERESAGCCEEFLPMLSEYVDGELSEVEEARVEVHAASCAHCAKELAAQRATVGAMQLVEEVRPPAALRGRIAAATTGTRKVSLARLLRSRIESLTRMPRLGWALGTAAAAVVAALMVSGPRETNTAKPVVRVAPTPPRVVAVVPKEAPKVTAPAPVQRPAEIALRKAVTMAVVAARPAEPQAPVIIRPAVKHKAAVATEPAQEKKLEVAVHVEETRTKVAEEVTKPEKDVVAVKPAEETAEKKPESNYTKIKLAVTPAVSTEEVNEYFKDVKVSAEMKRRMDNSIQVDVINKRF